MPNQSIDDLIRILQLAISPIVLISGVGLLILSMTNRLSRIMDRMRSIQGEIKKSGDADGIWDDQLTVLFHQSSLLRRGLKMFIFSILFDSLIVIALFIIKLTGLGSGISVAVLFTLSMICLILGLLYFMRDISFSLRAIELEMSRQPKKQST
jgi:hypothetical protein